MNSGASRLREFLCSLALCRAVKESISDSYVTTVGRAAEARRGGDQKQENKRRKENRDAKRLLKNLLLTKPQEWKCFLVQSIERELEKRLLRD